MVEVSQLPASVELPALLAPVSFFALAVGTYAIHGVLNDTGNQPRRPHRLGKQTLPGWLTPAFMVLLIAAELGGTIVLGYGVVVASG